MGTFVRLLPRLLFLGVAAVALLVLAGRERSAHADAPPPVTSPELTEPSLPPVTAPSLPAPPPPPAPPPIAAPSLPPAITPSLPAPAIPSIAAPAPAAPSVGGTELPTPPVPAPPGVPDVDPETLSPVVGLLPTAPALPEVPDVAPPLPGLPDLSSVPAVPHAPTPLDRVLELSATPAPNAPVPVNAPDRSPPVPLAEPAPSRLVPREPGGMLVSVDVGFTPARGPPTDAPGSPHACRGGGSPHPTGADQAAFLAPATGDASRRAGLLAEARAYLSTLLRDPLLRPD